jgi:hypothetical protein
MSASYNFKMNLKTPNLDKLALKYKEKYQAQVGVIGDKSKREEKDGLTNAELLLIHEKGSFTKNIPRRSVFESLNTNKDELSKDIKMIVSNDIKRNNPIYETYFKIALSMLDICREAFFTNGYGKWPPLKQKTIDNKLKKVSKKNKGNANMLTLVDSGSLLNSFTFRVKKMK